ncbi:MAG: N-acetylmuramoyl-L-alanine amidase [Chloroflexota bacterium]|nr:N-acetylmuramoyl-L-alanine amidase [Chloroflexota bacterium]
MQRHSLFTRIGLPMMLALVCSLVFMGLAGGTARAASAVSTGLPVNTAFTQASQRFGVPVAVLKALCYMEGRLSNHGGSPSMDNGYGCMHLVKNTQGNTLDRAAKDLGVSEQQLKSDIGTNILGGAAVLHDYALQSSHALPASLSGWYGPVAAYSNATTRSTALMYADALYKLINKGFSAQAETGEAVSLAAQQVRPDTTSAASVKGASTIPAGCSNDGKVDYPGAIDCIVDPSIFDCNISPYNYPGCTYEDANRPTDFSINYVSIHDIEGTALEALNAFQNHNSGVSVHYIVDSDGTVYQVIHEKDIAYHIGNYWYNQHSIGIEHAGFDATGFQWYNATEYLASAKLVAYLLQKYHIPLDKAHVMAHGTTPSPLPTLTNHVDPGPYWLWDYYFNLIHQQGVPYPHEPHQNAHIISLHPKTDKHPYGKNGTETPANFNFFYLYNGPSTTSGLIPQLGNGSDVTDETDNVEPLMSYYYLAKVKDPAGSGDTMYEIWYGESDQANSPTPSLYADAHLAWLAVPPGAAVEGPGVAVALTTPDGSPVQIYGKPATGATAIGEAPSNSVFASEYTFIEDGTTNLWYEINYNHRQAWIPASNVTVVHAITSK